MTPPELLNHFVERSHFDGDDWPSRSLSFTETGLQGSASRNTRSSSGLSTSPTAFARTVIRPSYRNLRQHFDRFWSWLGAYDPMGELPKIFVLCPPLSPMSKIKFSPRPRSASDSTDHVFAQRLHRFEP